MFDVPSGEHLILNALGGRIERAFIICGDCNNDTGSDIDDKFLKALQFITTLVDPVGRRKKAPTLRNQRTVDGDVFAIGPGGDVRVERRKMPGGGWVGDTADAEKIVADATLAAAAKSKRDRIPISVGTETGEIYNPTFNFRIELEGHVAFRSAIKTALEAVSYVAANSRFVEDVSLDPMRSYVLNSATAFPSNVGYLVTPVLRDLLGALEQSILLIQQDDGSIYFEFHAYGGVISVAGLLPPIKARFGTWLHRIDPVTGLHKTLSPNLVSPTGQNWSVDPDAANHQRTIAAIRRVAALWQSRGNDKTIGRIIDETLSEILDEPGKPITQEHVNAIAHAISKRFMDFMSKTSRSKMLDKQLLEVGEYDRLCLSGPASVLSDSQTDDGASGEK